MHYLGKIITLTSKQEKRKQISLVQTLIEKLWNKRSKVPWWFGWAKHTKRTVSSDTSFSKEQIDVYNHLRDAGLSLIVPNMYIWRGNQCRTINQLLNLNYGKLIKS
jgi:hypothetical protein